MRRIFSWVLILLFLFAIPVLCVGNENASAGLVPTPRSPAEFGDIYGHWAKSEVEKACQNGLMSGVGINSEGQRIFAPDTLVNRAQLASVLQRTFKLDYGQLRFIKQPLASDYYNDVDNNSWYANAAMICAINQIFDDSNSFNPVQNVTRIETALAIQRCFNTKKINVPMIMLMPVYRDMQGLSQDQANALVFASNTGIMKGDGQNFRPHDLVKRAELARILNRCTELAELNTEVKNKVDESYNGKTVTLKAGESLVLSLESNPTTGYTWNPADSRDDRVLSLVDQGYQSNGTSNTVGQGGTNYWKFKALNAGSTEIQLNYARPWESVQPLKTFRLKIVVNPAS